MLHYLDEYPIFVALLAGIGLSISLGMETLSWTVRSLADAGQMGHFISRTNVFLYGARIFNLLFVMLISFFIDSGMGAKNILFIIGLSFVMVTIFHGPLTFSKKLETDVSKAIGLLLGVSAAEGINYNICQPSVRLAYFTALSTAVFTAGLSVPYVLASWFPEYRMTMSTISQIINSIGTVLLLFLVDPLMYRMMDKGALNSSISSYVKGRFMGYGIGAIILVFISLIVAQ
ncbi:lipid II flippase family protein [Fluviibacter phosphoraccumulans]|uniref:lipid II flippase family protein n=1 Tax=Fluviibacter phosphoraccumulans TaxID=1751046 RepID=UPI0010B6C76C|nr:DUF2837 family protein [Fluviibacter phosphoraccumulans]BCA66198.1 hypothetical protein SHINM1_018000 [Fluviibacter phosphoraccumulans]